MNEKMEKNKILDAISGIYSGRQKIEILEIHGKGYESKKRLEIQLNGCGIAEVFAPNSKKAVTYVGYGAPGADLKTPLHMFNVYDRAHSVTTDLLQDMKNIVPTVETAANLTFNAIGTAGLLAISSLFNAISDSDSTLLIFGGVLFVTGLGESILRNVTDGVQSYKKYNRAKAKINNIDFSPSL
jgi:hypothetical protein